VQFIDSNKLISAGAADGVIKLWDIRNYGFYSKKKFPISADYSVPSETSIRKYGITSLTLSPDNSVFASCMDNQYLLFLLILSIYEFGINNLKAPINAFTAKSYKCGSFYVRTSISPDGRFLCSGSSDGNLHIWEVNLPLHAPFLMSGYEEEITGVSWSSGDLDQVIL
jgi:WD40 repeat protein